MYKALQKVLEMSNDTRVSDRQFRAAIQHIIDWRFAAERLGYEERLKRLHQEAIFETERDAYNKLDEEWKDMPKEYKVLQR